jgi:DNA polymerase-4
MYRVIFHLDMDAFYASVEQRDDPTLRGRPVIVGAPPTQRGVVCAASYEARKFGVRSAMPSITAKRLCPDGIFVRPRMDAYREESRRIMEILAGSGAVVEQVSVDEAYLDLSALCQAEDGDASLRKAVPLAQEFKRRIKDERQLTATVGIGSNKLLAKIASDLQRPDGLTLKTDTEKVFFLRRLPVRTLYGVGAVWAVENSGQHGRVASSDHDSIAALYRAFGRAGETFSCGQFRCEAARPASA